MRAGKKEKDKKRAQLDMQKAERLAREKERQPCQHSHHSLALKDNPAPLPPSRTHTHGTDEIIWVGGMMRYHA